VALPATSQMLSSGGQLAAADPSPRLWQVLAAPLLCIYSPGKVARTLAAAPRWKFAAVTALGVSFYAASIVLIVAWNETIPPRAGEVPGADAGIRTFAEVWSDWHPGGEWGPAERLFLTLVLGVLIAALFAAWLFLPTVYGGGSPWAAYGRSFRVVIGGIGVLWAASVVVGMTIAWMNRRSLLAAGEPSFDPEPMIVVGVFASAGGLIYWLTRAALGAPMPNVQPELPPRCEGCGYDLTHVPADGRCPECAASAADSLTPGRRPGAAWQRHSEAREWIETTLTLLFKPGAFYRALRMRDPVARARRFSWYHYPAIGCCGAAWIFLMLLSFDSPGWGLGMVFIPALFLFLVPLAGWAVHRVIGAFVNSGWIVGRTLPDARWAQTILAYETAYLWVFCLVSGSLLSSYFLFNNWVSDIHQYLGLPWFIGIPPESMAVLAGNGVACCLWLLRYRNAAQAARWSNF